MASFSQIANQGKNAIAAFDTKQLILLMGGAAVVVGVIFFFGHLIVTPDYKPLMTGMEPADAQALASRLAAKSIAYEISPDGKTVSVPGDKLDSSRLEVASEGMPHSGRLGFELFDKLNWGQTEFDEKVNYQRALEGELERTIQTLRDVESVRVHLVMPTDSVFLDREREAKASVILRLAFRTAFTRHRALDRQPGFGRGGQTESAKRGRLPMQTPISPSAPAGRDRSPMPSWRTSSPGGWSARWNRWWARSAYAPA